jgi:rod shape determining protein RodA
LVWSFSYVALPAILVLKGPDLGSALVIFAIWGGALLLSPIKKYILLILFGIFIISSAITWKFFLKDFQKDRIQVFINPSHDPRGKGYNVRQANIAIGSGWIFGKGLGHGQQSQNKFLPEKQTDFIFAAIGEEVGFFGSATMVLLYAFFLYRILNIMQKARDDLGMYIVGGAFFYIFVHIVINIGMNLGLLPVTGIPLLLTSAGGSSLLATFCLLGIIQNIAMQTKILRF